MVPYHARTCITHDFTNLFPHLRLIAMDWTVATCCLVFLKRAVFKTKPCVFHQISAFVTEFIPPCGVFMPLVGLLPFYMVMVSAVDTYHAFYGLLLSFHAGMHTVRNFLHARVKKEKLLLYLQGRVGNDQPAGINGLNT